MSDSPSIREQVKSYENSNDTPYQVLLQTHNDILPKSVRYIIRIISDFLETSYDPIKRLLEVMFFNEEKHVSTMWNRVFEDKNHDIYKKFYKDVKFKDIPFENIPFENILIISKSPNSESSDSDELKIETLPDLKIVKCICYYTNMVIAIYKDKQNHVFSIERDIVLNQRDLNHIVCQHAYCRSVEDFSERNIYPCSIYKVINVMIITQYLFTQTKFVKNNELNDGKHEKSESKIWDIMKNDLSLTVDNFRGSLTSVVCPICKVDVWCETIPCNTCNNRFCRSCFNKWRKTCPCCRVELM